MKTKQILTATVAGLMTVSITAPLLAGTGDTDMFKSADKKQTAKDFTPAPDKIRTDFGTLKFVGGAFPTEASVQKIYDELDLQRATQAYMDFYPALSVYAIVKSQIRDFKFESSSDIAVAWFKQHLKVYPLATGVRQGKFTNTTGMGINPLPPEDGSAFEMLNEIIQYEPSELFDKEQLGRLASLGIEKGKPFSLDKRMTRIFDQGAKQGVAMSRAIVYANRDPEILYWPDRHWKKMFVRNTEFLRNGYNDIDARTLWHYQAIVVSPNLISTTPGAGTAYLTSFRDKSGAYLDGARNYRLRVPANAPVKRFWAVTAYDPTTRGLLDAGGNRNRSVGSLDDPEVNADGSVDVCFGPRAPKGKERNWVPTSPDKGFFVVFRFYGPLKGYIEKTWVLNDFERVE